MGHLYLKLKSTMTALDLDLEYLYVSINLNFDVLRALSLQVQDQLVKCSKRTLEVDGMNSVLHLSLRVIGRESDSDVSSPQIRRDTPSQQEELSVLIIVLLLPQMMVIRIE